MWSEAVPNLLIGLREGLEGGLVTSILLVAVRRADPKASTAPVWLGVLAAVMLGMSFGAVLTFTQLALPPGAQEALAGILSVIAVALVTAMIFWMRTAARELSGELGDKVGRALTIGSRALAITAFLAVGRESLETALFLWTTVQAAGTTTAPLLGGAAGLVVAVLLCALLYRSSLRLNLGVFFRRTALLLAVIAAGVLAYGLGDLQKAGLLPGLSWVAFDLTGTIPADAWWVTVITGIFNLTPSMTWLQVLGYLGYLVVVGWLLLRPTRKPAPAATPEPAAAEPVTVGSATSGPAASESGASEPATTEPAPTPSRTRRRVAVGAVLVLVPAAIAGTVIAVRASGGATSAPVTVAAGSCAQGWSAGSAGPQTFAVANTSTSVGEIYLLRSDGGILQEIEGLGPGTRRSMTVDLPPGSYQWRCILGGTPQLSAVATVAGTASAASAAAPAVVPVAESDLAAPADAYRQQARAQLATLATQVDALHADIAANQLDAARADWLTAMLTWERVGAAYNSFGDLGTAIAGLPDALPQGKDDPGFTGLRRIEYGLWNGRPLAELVPVADKLVSDVAAVPGQLDDLTSDPKTLPVRAHEILEDALRDRLSGHSDMGAGTGFVETTADLDATLAVLDTLTPLLDARRPDLVPTVKAQIAQLRTALDLARTPTGWLSPATAPLAVRQQIDAATGRVLETLSAVPALLEIRPH